MYVTQKDKIKQEDIKANIYDTTDLIIDIGGVTLEDINKYINNEFTKIFPAEMYSRSRTELYEEEINSYESRNKLEMTASSKKRLVETETVLRYSSKNETEQISISTMFVSLKLIYKNPHKLNEAIKLISNIMEYFLQNDYLIIDRITLNKRDSVVCSSLYRLYQCLNKNLFGDIAYELSRKNGGNSLEFFLRNDTIFQYEKYFAYVSKTVKRGTYEDKDAYLGILQIDINTDKYELEIEKVKNIEKIVNCFTELNVICYKIFIEHITISFAEDLIAGTTNKVLGGFNKNEGI